MMERTSLCWRSAVALPFALGVLFPMLCAGQPAAAPPPNPPPPSVYSNPRAEKDDPRIGLRGGLHDGGEAAFGLQRVAPFPRPPGFPPGPDATATTPPP